MARRTGGAAASQRTRQIVKVLISLDAEARAVRGKAASAGAQPHPRAFGDRRGDRRIGRHQGGDDVAIPCRRMLGVERRVQLVVAAARGRDAETREPLGDLGDASGRGELDDAERTDRVVGVAAV